MDFDRLDFEQWTEEEFRMELFCVFCANIERNSIGGTLKDYLISLGVVRDALDYIVVSIHFYSKLSRVYAIWIGRIGECLSIRHLLPNCAKKAFRHKKYAIG